jgi:hypothetical protein
MTRQQIGGSVLGGSLIVRATLLGVLGAGQPPSYAGIPCVQGGACRLSALVIGDGGCIGCGNLPDGGAAGPVGVVFGDAVTKTQLETNTSSFSVFGQTWTRESIDPSVVGAVNYCQTDGGFGQVGLPGGIGNFAACLSGSNNTVVNDYSVVCGGYDNWVQVNGGIIGAGHDNYVGDQNTGILAGRFNFVTTEECFIGSGSHNNIYGDESFLGGGRDNNSLGPINGALNVIVGGLQNSIYGTTDGGAFFNGTDAGLLLPFGINGPQYCFIGGGEGNAILNDAGVDGEGGVIVGGEFNTLNNSRRGFIGGGSGNAIVGPSNLEAIDGVVCGGNSNTLTGGGAVGGFIGGGQGNAVSTSSYSAIVGGFNNANSGAQSFIGGGNGNTITAASEFSAIPGGTSNTVSGQVSLAFGDTCNVQGNHSVNLGYHLTSNCESCQAWGVNGTAVGEAGVVWGIDGLQSRVSQQVNAGGEFSTLGDAQWTASQVQGGTFDGGSANVLRTLAGADGLFTALDHVYRIEARIVATRTGVPQASNVSASSLVTVLVSRDSGGTVHVLSGSGSHAFTEDPQSSGWQTVVGSLSSGEITFAINPGSDTTQLRAVMNLSYVEVGDTNT